jgi:hypothetical protein
MFDLDLDGVFDELLEQLQPTPKPVEETPQPELGNESEK